MNAQELNNIAKSSRAVMHASEISRILAKCKEMALKGYNSYPIMPKPGHFFKPTLIQALQDIGLEVVEHFECEQRFVLVKW